MDSGILFGVLALHRRLGFLHLSLLNSTLVHSLSPQFLLA